MDGNIAERLKIQVAKLTLSGRRDLDGFESQQAPHLDWKMSAGTRDPMKHPTLALRLHSLLLGWRDRKRFVVSLGRASRNLLKIKTERGERKGGET
jgi:hypothetical protein